MTRAFLALPLALLLTVPAAAQAQMPEPGCHGIQVTDKAGDSANAVTAEAGGPSSDLTAGWITHDPATGKTLGNIRVAELTEGEVDPPYVAISWEWQFTTNAGPRFVRAYQDISGTVKYTWGEPRAITDDQTTPRAAGNTTGTLFPGKDGVIQTEFPLGDLGAPAGSQLKAIALEVRQWVSLPAAVPTLPVPFYSPAPIYDTATGKAFQLGPCPAPAPAGGGITTTLPGTPTTTTTTSGGKLALKVTVPRLSARKLAKTKKVTVKLTGTASRIVAALRVRSLQGKVVGSGKLASVNRSGKLTLKLRGRIKRGRYVLAVSGRNADGTSGEGAVTVTVKK